MVKAVAIIGMTMILGDHVQVPSGAAVPPATHLVAA